MGDMIVRFILILLTVVAVADIINRQIDAIEYQQRFRCHPPSTFNPKAPLGARYH